MGFSARCFHAGKGLKIWERNVRLRRPSFLCRSSRSNQRSKDQSEMSQSFDDHEHLSLFTTVSGSSENLGIVDVTEAVTEAMPTLGGAEMTPEAVGRVALCLFIAFASFEAHPAMLETVHTIWTNAGSSSVADARFFSFLSLVFSILLGGTFTFQYGRLRLIVRELFNEIYTLELFWYRCKKLDIGLEKNLRHAVRRYIETEIFFTEDKMSPFQEGSPLLEMYDVVEAKLQNGLETAFIMKSLDSLGTAQSRRSGAATKVLPYIHWALLWAIVGVFVFTFLTFEPFTSIDSVSDARNVIFAILCGISSTLVLAVQDLSRPIEGMYSLRREVKGRLGYLKAELK
ncbi:hypothetical protein BSKO_08811 [Bryopsis sp. KO-2023]|nr:hypothetical protein BSKO_08811 [Bryopsis sp. KO-2023]